MIFINRFCCLIALFVSMGCAKSIEEVVPKDKLAFSQNEITVFVNETLNIPVSFEKWDRGVYVKSEYDFNTNPSNVQIVSSDKAIAEVTSDGKIKGVSEGSCLVTMNAKDITVSGRLIVNIVKKNSGVKFTQDLTQPLSADMIVLWTYENNTDYFYVYKLSDLRNASTTAKTVTKTVIRTSHNKGLKVKAYDLNDIKPISKFPWTRTGTVTGSNNNGAVQGMCVYDDKIYVESGAKHDEAALVSVLDFQGNILQKQVKIGVSMDKQKLIDLNLSSDGTFEPEGMHIRNGVMYLGFVGDYPTNGAKKHACILKLK